MGKKGSTKAVVIFLFILVCLFAFFTYLYLQSVDTTLASEEKGVITESKEVFSEIWGNIRDILNIKVKNATDKLETDLGTGLVNLSFEMSPGTCKTSKNYICNDIQVDWEGNRIWFNMQNRMPGETILFEAFTVQGVECETKTLNQLTRFGETFSFVLEGCELNDEPSTFRVTHYSPTSGPSMAKSVEGTFRIPHKS